MRTSAAIFALILAACGTNAGTTSDAPDSGAGGAVGVAEPDAGQGGAAGSIAWQGSGGEAGTVPGAGGAIEATGGSGGSGGGSIFPANAPWLEITYDSGVSSRPGRGTRPGQCIAAPNSGCSTNDIGSIRVTNHGGAATFPLLLFIDSSLDPVGKPAWEYQLKDWGGVTIVKTDCSGRVLGTEESCGVVLYDCVRMPERPAFLWACSHMPGGPSNFDSDTDSCEALPLQCPK